MPSSNKCLNHEHCKGYALYGEKLCRECQEAERAFTHVYIDQKAENRAEYEHKQKGKK